LEEAEADRGLDRWNLKSVVVQKDLENCELYSVPAMHLAERRPPVLCGDPVKVQNSKGGIIFLFIKCIL
jgi:hypothetical protein